MNRDIELSGSARITKKGKTIVTSTGEVRPNGTAGLGYGTGAGGAVTQDTSKSTAVTLSKLVGQITLNAASLAAGAEATFTVTNSLVGVGDVPVACHGSAGTSGAYGVFISNVAAGAFDVTVSNLSAGALAEAIVVNFAIIKGAVA